MGLQPASVSEVFLPACFSVKAQKAKVKLKMSLGNNTSIITFSLLLVTTRKMCLEHNCKMISHIVYFYPFISQVFLDAASNLLWVGAEYGFLKFHPQNNVSLDKVDKDIIPTWQMSKTRQREVKYFPKVIQGAG